MAKDSQTHWVAVFRWPADNFEHDHVAKVSSVGPSRVAAAAALKANTNPDVRVSELEPMQGHDHLLDVTARVMANGGADYRGYGGSEQFLTIRKARELRLAESLPVTNLPEQPRPGTADAKKAEAVADQFADPPLAIPQ